MDVQPHKGRKELADVPSSTPCVEETSRELSLNPTPDAAQTFDASEFLHFLEGTGWTVAEKEEFTKALWQIVLSVVDMEFRACLLPVERRKNERLESDSSDMLVSDSNSKNESCEYGMAPGQAGRKDS